MTELTLIIGNKNYSSWSLRPWILMKNFNLDFSEKRIALCTETTDQELESYFSNYKVPVLLDKDFMVWDTLSIMEYVSENYLQNKAWPKDLHAKAFARSICSEMHSSFFSLRNELPMNCRKRFENFKFSSGAQEDIHRIKSLWKKCKVEYSGGGEWLFGEYSIADAMFAPIVLRFHGYDVPVDGSEHHYMQAVLNSPHIIDWIESSKAEKEIINMDEV